MSRFFSVALKSLTPYTPGEQPRDTQYVKLNTNESPYPPSKKALAMMSEEWAKLNLYPDPTCAKLSEAMAKTLGVDKNEVILGNGSDEILFFAFSAFCTGDKGAVYPNITYGFYDATAGLCGVKTQKIPLNEDLTVNVDDYCGIDKPIFIANPNAPTGIALPLADIEKIVKSNPDSIVVVDEAYVDFGAESAVPLVKKYDNIIVVQTFSKSRSMAGARLGVGIANPALIQDLNTVKYSLNPYNINKMTLAAGLGTLMDEEYTKACCAEIIKTRFYAQERLRELGFAFTKSSANFIFAKHGKASGKDIYLKLKQAGILVRHFDAPEICDYNRITIGTKQQMDTLFAALEKILEE